MIRTYESVSSPVAPGGIDRKYVSKMFFLTIGMCLQGLRKITVNLNQDSRSPDRDLNSGPPKCEAGVLPIGPRLSVSPSSPEVKKAWIFTFTHP
jgi:hypothetical protein